MTKKSGSLTIVATPIGNLGDITIRALEALKACDVILCEDTRVSQKLLTTYAIKKTLISYHEHNAASLRPQILARIEAGEHFCLISDAGTPLISDPGFKLVQECASKNLSITTCPGASSVLAGLVLSGMPSDRFFFAGFLPPKQTARQKALQEIKEINATLIFLEGNSRLIDLLDDIELVLKNRTVAVARELTKRFEEVVRGTPNDIKKYFANGIKGELVVIVSPPFEEQEELSDTLIKKTLETLSIKDTADALSKAYNIPKRKIYQRALLLSQQK